MSEVAAPATPAPVAAAEPPAGAPEAPKGDRSAQLIQKAVQKQAKLHAEEAAKQLDASDAPAGERERDPKTGHFLPAGAKPKPTKGKDVAAGAKVASSDPAGVRADQASGGTTQEEPDKPGPSADSKARRLVKQGKLAEAMQTIGLDPSRLESPKWQQWRHEQEKVATAIVEGRKQVEAERGEVQQFARQLVRDFEPFVKAKQAFDKGDYEEAFQHAFGTDLNSFQRKALQSMTQPGVAKDPVIAELRKEIASLRQERQQEREQMTEQQKQAELGQRRVAAWNGNVQALADSGDPKLAALSGNQKFMRIVWDIQAQHYDEQSDATLPALEAAELALETLESEHSEWSKVFGGGSPPSEKPATLARIQAADTDPGGTRARRTARAVTSLNPAEAAEAAPKPKLKGKALIDYYANKAKVEELRGLNGA